MNYSENGSNPAEKASNEMALKNGVPEFYNKIKSEFTDERADRAEKNLRDILESI